MLQKSLIFQRTDIWPRDKRYIYLLVRKTPVSLRKYLLKPDAEAETFEFIFRCNCDVKTARQNDGHCHRQVVISASIISFFILFVSSFPFFFFFN